MSLLDDMIRRRKAPGEDSLPPVPSIEEPLASRLRGFFAPFTGTIPKHGGQEADERYRPLLSRLFHKGDSLSLESARLAIPADVLEDLLEYGLLTAEAGQIRSLFHLQIIRGLLHFSDLPSHKNLPGYVLPVGAASVSMARLAIRRPVEAALDMGCGAGIQSLLTAGHARRVTATDVNPRGLAFTRLNAMLNGIGNIETLPGSHFDPVRGRRFGLVLFNAPYILSPLRGASHSHAGGAGDAYLYEVLATLPEYLEEGGFGQIITNWVHRASEDWWVPLQAGLQDRGLDALVMCRASLSAREYTDYWLRFEIDPDRQPVRYEVESLRWRLWYQRRGIQHIGFGSLVLRKRMARDGSDNWLRFEHVKNGFGDSFSDQMLAIFHNQDRGAASFSHEALAQACPQRVCITLGPSVDGKGRQLVVTSGQIFPLQIRNITHQVLARLDGRMTVDAAIRDACQAAGLLETDFRPGILEDVANLARLGWISFEPPW